MGGEGDIAPSSGILYPFVNVLATAFGAAVLEPEHRFYGASLPFGEKSFDVENLHLLTPQQAMVSFSDIQNPHQFLI